MNKHHQSPFPLNLNVFQEEEEQEGNQDVADEEESEHEEEVQDAEGEQDKIENLQPSQHDSVIASDKSSQESEKEPQPSPPKRPRIEKVSRLSSTQLLLFTGHSKKKYSSGLSNLRVRWLSKC